MATASVLLLFGCATDWNVIPENGSAAMSLDTVLATISRNNIQSSLNFLAADEREGRMTGSRGYDEVYFIRSDQYSFV